MKLHTAILKKIIDLQQDSVELRKVLDDVGLEVKGIEEAAHGTVFTIETLANRGDHLSALGVARELSARFLTPISTPKLAADITGLRPSISLRVETPLCHRVGLLELSGTATSRPEVTSCLGDSVHPETPMVDVSNYLQLEMGHPTHAFDLDTIEGEITIELTTKEEKITALDGKDYTLPIGSIVHRDKKKIIDVAGIIGCANTMVTATTKRYLVEAASFDPVTIRKTARAMGISTDASYAFERGQDREMITTALRRFVALAQSGGGSDDTLQVHAFTYYAGSQTEQRHVPLNVVTLRKQLNLLRLEEVEIQARLKALGYHIEPGSQKLSYNVLVPSWRLWDVEKEADLIEDVARSISLSRIKIELPPLEYVPPEPSAMEQVVYKIEPVLHGLGFYEAMTKSLYSSEEVALVGKYDPQLQKVHVATKNAIEKNCSHLKVTNILSLAKVFELNMRRGTDSFKVYETARVFREQFEKAGHPYEREYDVLSFAMGGRMQQGQWRKPETIEEQFYAAKGTLQAMWHALGLSLTVAPGSNPLLHPGRQASILAGKNTVIGSFGQIHPGLQDDLKISEPIIVAELDMFLLTEAYVKASKERKAVSDYPSITRDMTLQVKDAVWAQDVVAIVTRHGGENLHSVEMVDEFKKPQEDFRRVTYRMTFQNLSRTLTSGEVDASFATIIQALETGRFSLAV